MRLLGSVAAGAVLFALPFLSMGVGTSHHDGTEPHSDHAARYGGLLLMVDDHHLEVVEFGKDIAIYVSDSRRIPVKPVSGLLHAGSATPVDLVWERDRLVALDVPDSDWADYEVALADGTRLMIGAPRLPHR